MAASPPDVAADATLPLWVDISEDGEPTVVPSTGVTTEFIADQAVTAAKIANDTITAAQIAANAVGSSELADNAVDTNAIQDGAVTTVKIADGAVTPAKISGIGNLLTPNQASGTVDADVRSNCSHSGNTFTASNTTSSMAAGYTVSGIVPLGVYTLEADLTTVGLLCKPGVSWRNAGGSQIAYTQVPSSQFIAEGTTGTAKATATAPAGTTSCIFYFVDGGPVVNGVTSVTVNRLGFWKGAGGSFALPGTPILHTGRRVTHPNSTDTLIEVWDDGAGAWVVAEYDSGWRDVSGLLESGASGVLKVRRAGPQVFLASYNLTSTTNGMWTVPSGFRPSEPGDNKIFPIVKYDGTAGVVSYGSVGTNKIDMSPAGMKGYAAALFTWSWQTLDAIPSSLPGTPA